jgi:glycosyltransferase involved in cell wall biosynthesis
LAAWAPTPKFCPPGVKHIARTARSLHEVKKKIRAWEAEQGKAMELVFFACIYDDQFRRFKEAKWALPYQWSGMYLNSRPFRMPGTVNPQSGEKPCPARIFRAAKLHALAVLDEGVTAAAEKLCGRPVVVFPDLTDEGVAKEQAGLLAKIKTFAAGAPVVAALGHMQHTKGVVTLARLAMDPANRDWCFAFVGEAQWGLFKPEDRALIAGLADRCPNVFAHFESVPDGENFNSAVQAADVIFAGYLNFPNSSNILTKAAVFRKPLIVSDGYVMAERVRKYALGEVVPEGDVAATGRAIREILQDKNTWLARRKPRWEEYHAQHSYARLKDSFSKLLESNAG